MEQWEKNYYITALAGANNGSSLVVMSRGNTVSAWAKKKNSLACLVPGICQYVLVLFLSHLGASPITQYKFQLNFTGIISSINIVQHSCSMALTDFPYNILLFFPEVLYSEIKRTSLIFFVKLQFQPFRWRLLQFKLLSSNILCRLVLTLNSPGTQYAQQSYKVSDSFPFKWINKKWREGFYVTAMATAGSRWAVVMSRNAGFTAQVC